MRILLSNDDGIDAPGLAALRAAIEDLGTVDVVAPASGQSAAGHSITLHEPLVVRRTACGPGGCFEGLSVTGRPADCVRLAAKSLVDAPPDLVLSGINIGANVGVNVFYSGTVAAAAEGAMLGFPAVALSASSEAGEPEWSRVAEVCREVLDRLLGDGLAAGDLVNVNVPALGGKPDRPVGLRVVRQCTGGVEDAYYRVEDIDDARQFRIGEEFNFLNIGEDTDVAALAKGFVTVTPLHVDMTNHDRLGALRALAWERPGAH